MAEDDKEDDKDKKHPLFRGAKWAGAVSAIGGILSALVVGVWQVGEVLDEIEDSQRDFAEYRSEESAAREEMERRNDIQEEILANLRIAVASLQAVIEYRESHPELGSHPEPGTSTATSGSRTHRRVSSDRLHEAIVEAYERVEPPPPLPITPPESPPPTVEELRGTLPPLPEPPPELVSEDRGLGGGRDWTSPSADFDPEDFVSERADVALERAEILQDAL